MERKLPSIGNPLRTGELVMLGYDDFTVKAVVTHASPNGRSIVLSFEAIVGGHVGMMPVWQRDDGSYETLMTREAITITRPH